MLVQVISSLLASLRIDIARNVVVTDFLRNLVLYPRILGVLRLRTVLLSALPNFQGAEGW